jgi:hypothetical protein
METAVDPIESETKQDEESWSRMAGRATISPLALYDLDLLPVV